MKKNTAEAGDSCTYESETLEDQWGTVTGLAKKYKCHPNTLRNWIQSGKLSAVRFGVQQGILEGLTPAQLNRALLLTQPAHLQRLANDILTPDERDEQRALLIRRLLESED